MCINSESANNHMLGISAPPTTPKICVPTASLISVSVRGKTLFLVESITMFFVLSNINHMPIMYPPNPKNAKCPRERIPQ